MLKVAILSGWHVHAEGYANEFASNDESTLTALWDEDPERGKTFAAKHKIPFYASLDELLAQKDVDAVCVNAPTAMHREVMVKSANANKHIFTEKVLALKVKEAGEIKDAIIKAGVKFCISFPHRGIPHNLFAKQIVCDGTIGKITLLRVRNAHNGVSAGWLPPHFLDKNTCGGGAMIDLGAHPMYLCDWLMGRPVEISSAFTSVYGSEVEDNSVSVMKFPDGSIAISETSFVSEASPFALELYGTKGILLIGKDGVWLKDAAVPANKLPEALPSPIAQFIRGVLHGEKIHYGIDDAVSLTAIMEAAYKSHEEKRHIKL